MMIQLTFVGLARPLYVPTEVEVLIDPVMGPAGDFPDPTGPSCSVPTKLIARSARDEIARHWLRDFYTKAGDESPWEIPEGLVRPRHRHPNG
jgi:hypothetical protein